MACELARGIHFFFQGRHLLRCNVFQCLVHGAEQQGMLLVHGKGQCVLHPRVTCNPEVRKILLFEVVRSSRDILHKGVHNAKGGIPQPLTDIGDGHDLESVGIVVPQVGLRHIPLHGRHALPREIFELSGVPPDIPGYHHHGNRDIGSAEGSVLGPLFGSDDDRCDLYVIGRERGKLL